MTDQEIRIAIAEACGWAEYTGFEPSQWWPPGALRKYEFLEEELPDYPNDLNAMHEAENSLNGDQTCDYIETLWELLHIREYDPEFCIPQWPAVNAPARQRAEAFLRTLNLWKD